MRLRLLPLLAGAAALGIGVKVADMAFNLSSPAGELRLAAEAQAQTAQAPGQNAAEPAPQAAPAAPGPETPAAEGGDLQFNQPVETTDSGVELPADLSGLTRAEVQLLTDLARRRAQLDEREMRITEREALLTATEEQLREQQAQLVLIKSEIEALVARYESDGEQDLANLIQTYRQMKPRSASVIWNDMELDTLLPIARGIPPRQIAPIIAGMDPEKARLLTRELAAREELPPVPQ